MSSPRSGAAQSGSDCRVVVRQGDEEADDRRAPRIAAALPRHDVVDSHHDAGRSQPGAHPRSRAATARRSPSGIVRVARPTSSGWPATVQHDRHDGRVAAQHPQRLGDRMPPKSRHAARARFSRSSSRTSTLTWGRWPPQPGPSRVVQHVPAHVGQRLGLPLPGRAVVVAGQRLGLRVDHRSDRVEHRGVVEPALELAAAGRGPASGTAR